MSFAVAAWTMGSTGFEGVVGVVLVEDVWVLWRSRKTQMMKKAATMARREFSIVVVEDAQGREGKRRDAEKEL